MFNNIIGNNISSKYHDWSDKFNIFFLLKKINYYNLNISLIIINNYL